MVLTYAFSLGATHLVFVSILGGAGIDWKVPYFLFVLLVAVGVDYNVFLMARLREESNCRELGEAIIRAVGQTGGLITRPLRSPRAASHHFYSARSVRCGSSASRSSSVSRSMRWSCVPCWSRAVTG